MNQLISVSRTAHLPLKRVIVVDNSRYALLKKYLKINTHFLLMNEPMNQNQVFLEWLIHC